LDGSVVSITTTSSDVGSEGVYTFWKDVITRGEHDVTIKARAMLPKENLIQVK
jgi:hypothetical protein